MQWFQRINPFWKGLDDSSIKAKLFFDRTMYVVAFLGPLMSLPQVIKIGVEKSAASVSALSWASFAFLSIFWLTYAILHKKTPLIISSAGSLLVQFLVVLGTIIY